MSTRRRLTASDAALLAACAEFDTFERLCNSLYYDATRIEDDAERDEAIAPIRKASQPSLERVCGLPARTLAGLQARARTILLENLDLDPAVDAMEGSYTNERLVAALLRDLLAMGAA